ncbi:hypothetical protein FHX42_005168 [Saccharopolyspora lacisalsi]|uniref:Uncharacterized protein n=1 Tax=Halosaccharopolyspora lacisalsi TaxID=1000566 RepID=A0A839E913_9PSEU|nr:hypothetical protein [Halosaccharopolyspora lacisalsi]MBA8827761.1 hypothetical protein [Halosaccharopolyspora lacisalsi]
MTAKRTTTGGGKQVRENARQAAFNLIPPAQVQAAEDFGEAAAVVAAGREHQRQLEETYRSATEHARDTNWNSDQLRQLLTELGLDLELPKRKPRSTSSGATSPPQSTTGQSPNGGSVNHEATPPRDVS